MRYEDEDMEYPLDLVEEVHRSPRQHNSYWQHRGLPRAAQRAASAILFAFAGAGAINFAFPEVEAWADPRRVVGEIKGSGFAFNKDTLNVEGFEDPKVDGVTCYLTGFSKPFVEKIGAPFEDPAAGSMTCVKTGKVIVADSASRNKEGEPVFEEAKSMLNGKTIIVRRIYDEEKRNVLWVSYTQRIDKGNDSGKSRFSSSISAVHVD
ncbi:unnamed protein product [Chrysoparadoxa australica]